MTQATVVARPADLVDLVGRELGVSEPISISQEQVDAFAAITGDHQWIHVDVDRAREGPFGSTIVHGFLTLSMVPVLLADVMQVEQASMGLNYGLDRVRFIQPLKPGQAVRAHAELVEATRLESPDGVQAKARVTLRFDHDDQPCSVADVVFRFLD